MSDHDTQADEATTNDDARTDAIIDAMASVLSLDRLRKLLPHDDSAVLMTDLMAATRDGLADDYLVAHYDGPLLRRHSSFRSDRPAVEKTSVAHEYLIRERLKRDARFEKVDGVTRVYRKGSKSPPPAEPTAETAPATTKADVAENIAPALTGLYLVALLPTDGSPLRMSELLRMTKHLVSEEDAIRFYVKLNLKAKACRAVKASVGHYRLVRDRLQKCSHMPVRFAGKSDSRADTRTVALVVQGASAAEQPAEQSSAGLTNPPAAEQRQEPTATEPAEQSPPGAVNPPVEATPGQADEVEGVRLLAIEYLQVVQSREAISSALVDEYSEMVQAGVEFDPIEVITDGVNSWVWDGGHRKLAYNAAGELMIPARVRRGTLDDARWFASGANRKHGQRRTQADVRVAIEMALRVRSNETDRAIAAHIGCDHKTVGKVRREMQTDGEIPQVENRVGRDGKTYDTSAISEATAARAEQFSEFTRDDARGPEEPPATSEQAPEATQHEATTDEVPPAPAASAVPAEPTPEEDDPDADHIPDSTPEQIASGTLFLYRKRQERWTQLARQVAKLDGLIADIADDKGGELLRERGSLYDERFQLKKWRELLSVLTRSKPYALGCRECNGTGGGTLSVCRSCKGRPWVTQQEYMKLDAEISDQLAKLDPTA